MVLETRTIVYVFLGAFNLFLALLLAGARPRRVPQFLVATFAAGNGAFAFLEVATNFHDFKIQKLIIFANTPTLFALAVLPFVFPRRILSRGAERALLMTAALCTLVNWVLLITPGVTVRNTPSDPVLGWTSFVPFFVGLCVGTFILLHEFLSGPSPIGREQARYLLAAYLIKITSYLGVFWSGLLNGNRQSWVSALNDPFARVFTVLLTATFGGVVVAILFSRLRGPPVGVPSRPLWQDAFVLLIGISGAPLAAFDTADAEYMLIRPLLLTYAILRFQFLDVDARARRSWVVASVLIGLATIFAFSAYKAESFEASPAGIMVIAFGATLGFGVLLGWPLLRLLPGFERLGTERPDDLYRAALEEVAASGNDGATPNEPVLRALRSRLQISEREHATMAASLDLLLGRRGAPFAAGRTVLGRYELVMLLGEGGFGRTFLANDLQMHRRVVIKASRTESPKEAQRVLQEARAIAAMRHPNVVTIHDVEQVGDEYFLVLEYVEGGSVADRMREGRFDAASTLSILVELLSALEAAHQQGIIHRDIKPANILLTSDGHAKLADFGIARRVSADETAQGLSVTASQPGTLRYMAPEQIRGSTTDERTDLYALAATAYEMLTGRSYLAFDGRTDFDLRLSVLKQKPRFPIPGIPTVLNAVLRDALSKEPDGRPRDAKAMQERLVASAPRRLPASRK